MRITHTWYSTGAGGPGGYTGNCVENLRIQIISFIVPWYVCALLLTRPWVVQVCHTAVLVIPVVSTIRVALSASLHACVLEVDVVRAALFDWCVST